MEYEVHTKELPAQLALTVQTRTTLATIAQTLGAAFAAIMTEVQAGRAHPAGPPFSLYPGEVAEEFDMVVCMPVAPGATAGPEVALEEVPGGNVATTMHRGSYAHIGAAYEALRAWMDEHGAIPGRPVREVYLTSPDEVPAADLLTEVDWTIG